MLAMIKMNLNLTKTAEDGKDFTSFVNIVSVK